MACPVSPFTNGGHDWTRGDCKCGAPYPFGRISPHTYTGSPGFQASHMEGLSWQGKATIQPDPQMGATTGPRVAHVRNVKVVDGAFVAASPTEIEDRIKVVEGQKARLVDYLKLKVEEQDWHGVEDAASDIRDKEAEIQGLRWGLGER